MDIDLYVRQDSSDYSHFRRNGEESHYVSRKTTCTDTGCTISFLEASGEFAQLLGFFSAARAICGEGDEGDIAELEGSLPE